MEISEVSEWLDKREKIVSKASDGPWRTEASGWSDNDVDQITDSNGETVIYCQDERGGSSWENDEDADFIVDSRFSVPAITKGLKAVINLADMWESKAKFDKEYAESGAVPEEIKESIHDSADEMLWAANTIRHTIINAMKEEIAASKTD